MKKTETNQRTLFQSWGKKNTAKNNRPLISHTSDTCSAFDPQDIIAIDDDDDDGLLEAALAMDSTETTVETPCTGSRQTHTTYQTPCQTARIQTQAPTLDRQTPTSNNPTTQPELLPGFDMDSGNVWIYPTNYPIREYQYNIVEKALYQNTMVTLPTGLGKTFIAAVIMYNYFRWYPQGKVVFMAPTKPLVAQQIEACYNIMGIPQEATAQMTGNLTPSKREVLWRSRRVFFLTPQVLQNDLSRGTCVADDIVLVVIDEAHKALGNHAYCQVVREIYGYTRRFRVLALSATPGDDIKAVQQVLTNLLISHVELRSEDSPDIQPYTHARTIDKIVVPVGQEITQIKTQYLKVLEGIVGRLFCNRAIWQKDPLRVSKFMLLSSREQFRKGAANNLNRAQLGSIEADFAMGISLYHAYELLHQHGILSFYNFIKGIMDGTKSVGRAKTELLKHPELMDVLQDLSESIEAPPDDVADNGALFSQVTSPRRQRSMQVKAFDPRFKSHPKLLKLEEVVVDHFQKYAKSASTSEGASTKPSVDTRVMIFSQYRDSVNEITTMLCKHKPLVRVMSFIGQASTGKASRGLSQKEQLQVVHKFRSGGYNTLVSTCVGEEGLDIGDVDLIVCFDVHASPIRMIQRMGRTGRKRDGRIVVLVTEGKEEQVYKRSQSNKKSIHKAIVKGTKSFELYDDNPRMIPKHLTPTVLKMPMTVAKYVSDNSSNKRRKSDANQGKGNIKTLLSRPVTPSCTSVTSDKNDGLLNYEELMYWQEHFKLPDCEAGTTPKQACRQRSRTESPATDRRRSRDQASQGVKPLSLTEWMAWQSALSPVHLVTHSRRTQHLVEVLEFIELHGREDKGQDDSYDVEMSAFLDTEDITNDQENAEEGNKSDITVLKGRKKPPTAKHDNETSESSTKNNNTKKKAKKRLSKDKAVSPEERKARWKEYLKSFEKDEDFDTIELEKDICGGAARTSSASVEISVYEPTKMVGQVKTAERFKLDDAVFENEPDLDKSPNQNKIRRSSKDNVESDENESCLESLSQLLPSSTPRDNHPTNSRLLALQRDRNHVPTPPSLDGLDLSFSSAKSDQGSPLKRRDAPAQRNGLRRTLLPLGKDATSLVDHSCEAEHTRPTEPFGAAPPDVAMPEFNTAKDTFGAGAVPCPPPPPDSIDIDIDFGDESALAEALLMDEPLNIDKHSRPVAANDLISSVKVPPNAASAVNKPCSGQENEATRQTLVSCRDQRPGQGPVRSQHQEEHQLQLERAGARLGDVNMNKCSSKLSRFLRTPKVNDLPQNNETTSVGECTENCTTIMDSERVKEPVNSESAILGLRHDLPNLGSRQTLRVSREPLLECTRNELENTSISKSERNVDSRFSKTDNSLNKIDQKIDKMCKSLDRKYTSPGKTALPKEQAQLRKDKSPVCSKVQVISDKEDSEDDSPVKAKRRRTKANVLDSPGLTPTGITTPLTGRRSHGVTTSKGCVVAIAESEEEVAENEDGEEEESPIKPVGRARKYRRQALSSPLSQPTTELTSGRPDELSSEEEFENVQGVCRSNIGRAVPRKKAGTSKKTSRLFQPQKRVRGRNDFIDEEAELSGSDIDELSSEENEEAGELDSFIDDSTQQTQPASRARHCSPAMDMHALYRQSLISPVGRQLNFRTPTFRQQRNRYKMKYKMGGQDEDSASEAEETYENESELENEASSEDDVEDSPLHRRRKSVKRKRHLDDSIESGSSKLRKHCESTTSPTPQRSKADPDNNTDIVTSLDKRETSNNVMLKERDVAATNGADTDTPKPTPRSLEDQELQEIAAAMADTDDTIAMDICDMPSFSLGFDTSLLPALDESNTGASPSFTDPLSSIDVEKPPLASKTLNCSSKKPVPSEKVNAHTGLKNNFAKPSPSLSLKTSPPPYSNAKGSDMEFKRPSLGSKAKTFSWPSDRTSLSSTLANNQSRTSLHNITEHSNEGAKKPLVTYNWSPDIMKSSERVKDQAGLSSGLNDSNTPRISSTSLMVPSDKGKKKPLTSKTFNWSSDRSKSSSNTTGQTGLCNNPPSTSLPPHRNDAPSSMVTKKPLTSKTFNWSSDRSKSSLNTTGQTGLCNNPPSTSLPPHHNEAPSSMVSKKPLLTSKTFNWSLDKSKSSFAKVGHSESRSAETHMNKNAPCGSYKGQSHVVRPVPSFDNKTSNNQSAMPPPTITTSPSGLTQSERNKDKLLVLVDTKVISNSQIVSLLRRQYHIRAEVCPLTHCDYVVSTRMAVERKLVSAVSNGANSTKLLARMRLLCSLYERPCLIIEKDRVKPGETERDFTRSTAYHSTLTCIALTHIKILYSNSQEDTAHLISELAIVESKKKTAISAPLTTNKQVEQVFHFLLSIPYVNYVTALTWCWKFRTIRDVINSSPSDLQKISSHLSRTRAEEICAYLRHCFNPDMLATIK